MQIGHEQVEVDLKYLDEVAMQMMPATLHGDLFWQVEITMLNSMTYHENFDSITAAADRVIEVRDWRLTFIGEKLDDLMEALSRSDLPAATKEEMSEIYLRRYQ